MCFLPESKSFKSSINQNMGLRVKLSLPREKDRAELEKFIALKFMQYYKVELTKFYPELLAIYTHKTQLIAVAGLRCASQEQLFTEYYLSNPVENYIENLLNKSISRDGIVEIGNLSPANIGQMRWLITTMTAFLYAAGYQVVVFTVIKSIINSFKRMGLDPIIIKAATRDQLPANLSAQWTKHYYDKAPHVCIGDLGSATENIYKNIVQKHPTLLPIWNIAYRQGELYRQTRYIIDTVKNKSCCN